MDRWEHSQTSSFRDRALGPEVQWSRKGRARLLGRIMLSFLLFPVPFVKGDSHPELCAQRTDEGGGFYL
jgi:hypothetical protein